MQGRKASFSAWRSIGSSPQIKAGRKTIDTLEERDVTQRDLIRLERWAGANLMDLNRAKLKVMHIDWSNLKGKYSLEENG